MNSLIRKYTEKDILFLLSSFLVFYVKKEIWGMSINEEEYLIVKEFILSNGYDDNILNYIYIDFLLESIIENNAINISLDNEKLRSYLSKYINKNKVYLFNHNEYKLELKKYETEKLIEKIEKYLKMEKIPHRYDSIHIQKVILLTDEYKSRDKELLELFKKNNKCLIM